jgi:hypothetical protein
MRPPLERGEIGTSIRRQHQNGRKSSYGVYAFFPVQTAGHFARVCVYG